MPNSKVLESMYDKLERILFFRWHSMILIEKLFFPVTFIFIFAIMNFLAIADIALQASRKLIKKLKEVNEQNFFCKCLGHKWPYLINVLISMAMIEVKNDLPCVTKAKCTRRGCNAERNLNNEIRDTIATAEKFSKEFDGSK